MAAKTGRKTKLTKSLVKRARDLAAEFKTDKEIYTCLGISETSFYEYKRGDSNDPLAAAFTEALKKGHEEYLQLVERECLERIQKADAWQSDAWILERMLPEKYARTDRIQAEVQQNTQATVKCELFFDYGDE